MMSDERHGRLSRVEVLIEIPRSSRQLWLLMIDETAWAGDFLCHIEAAGALILSEASIHCYQCLLLGDRSGHGRLEGATSRKSWGTSWLSISSRNHL
jgi:hypothetical protein